MKTVCRLLCYLAGIIFGGNLLLWPQDGFSEVMYKGDIAKIPKFPAPKLPDSYEPPEWQKYPWHPPGQPEKFDIKQPDAAEKIMWNMKDSFDSGYCFFSGAAFLMDENRFGHIRRLMGSRWIAMYYMRDFQDLLSYHEGKVNAGDFEFKDVIYLNEPPPIRALATLTWKYVETPANKKEQERWTYVPALRRTRRLAAGADDDKIAGTDFTVDDVGQRDVWEEEFVLIGEDQLGPEEHTFYHVKPPKDVAPRYGDLYRPKSFDCWVILGVNRKPRYYFPKRLIWIDKKTFLFVREEQYDFHGNLWKVYDYGWRDDTKKWAPDAPPDLHYYSRMFWNIWDLKINHRTFNLIYGWTYDDKSPIGWAGKGPPPDSFFDVKRLEREEAVGEMPPAPLMKRLNDVVFRPKLLRGKQMRFEAYRPIVLPEEIEKKLLKEYGE